MPFVLLVVGLLAGSLVCLLVVNTTLATGAIRINTLAQANSVSTQRLGQLRQTIAADQSATVLEREAMALGMRPDPQLTFVDLRGRGLTGHAGGATLARTAASGGRHHDRQRVA
jgi:hypothetical protein